MTSVHGGVLARIPARSASARLLHRVAALKPLIRPDLGNGYYHGTCSVNHRLARAAARCQRWY
ncbi:MAG TPA: hypothetical protein VGM78_05790 [Ilumatobacteraceae bacterium]|jgi:hypothetical protein